MTDKELFNYFKSRSHTLNETPGDALWNSIASKMDNKPMPKTKGLLTLTLAAITAIGVITYLMIPQDVKPPVQQDNLPKQTTGIDTSNSISTSETEEVKTEQITESQPAINTNHKETLVKPKHQNKIPQTESISSSLNGIKLQDIKQDTVKPSGIKLFTQKYNGRILVQAKEKITQAQFDSLVKASFNTYKKEYNTLLIVRAPGLTPYRERITKYTPQPGADTLSTVKAGYVEFRPIYKKPLDTLAGNETFIKSGDSSNSNEAVIQPSYPGGLDMLMKHVNEKLIIPDNLPNGVYKVYAHLNINPEGSISKIEIMRKAGYGLDEAVIEAVKKIKTKWEPMIIDGKPANSSFVIPITITIR